MIRPWPHKDPDERLPYWFSAEDFCADEGSDVVSYELAVDEGDDALVVDDDARSGNVISLWCSEGTLAVKYTVRCRVTLQNGTVADCSRTLTIEQQ